MQFSKVIGQKETKEQLMHMVQHNRLSHALLFLGREGTGALSLARAMAQYVVCEKVNGKQGKNTPQSVPEAPSLFGEAEPAMPKDTGDNREEFKNDSCGECPSCMKAAKMVHPDIHFSYPVIPKKSGDKPVSTDYMTEWREFLEKHPYGNSYSWLQFIDAENKQGNITAQECNDITRKMSLKSFEAGYKILIMWMPELLGKEGNKLLKLIEEPPPDTLFLFVAENEAAILPTILSRTQLIRIPPLTRLDIEAALELQEGLSVKKAEQIAAISNGNYNEALEQLAHADDDWEVFLRDWLNSIIKTGPVAQVKWIDEISKIGREKQKQFLVYFIHLMETAIKLRIISAPDGESSLNDFALRFNKLCSLEQQEAIVNELDQAIYYVERNANAKMLFHALTIKLYHIISNKSVILMQ
jgi:DNA polymerase-3 subunit delta'